MPDVIIGDKDRLEQVLVHLLQNGIKYTPKNGQILLYTQALQEGLKIGVKDTGIGIAQDKQRLLFSFFSPHSEELIRNHSTEEEKEFKNNLKESSRNLGRINCRDKNLFQHNTFHGLGLQITQKLVKSMNSKLRVKSRVNQGTEFYFLLKNLIPKVCSSELSSEVSTNEHINIISNESFAEDPTSWKFEIEENASEDLLIYKKMSTYSFTKDATKMLPGSRYFEPKKKQKALVVDDNGVNRIAISGLLRRQGLDVIQKTDGLEAVEEMKKEIDKFKEDKDRKQLVNCIFMDLNMPNMDGIEPTNIINTMLNEVNITIPIFALTAYDTNQLKTHCLQHGFTLFLIKPIKQDALNDVLFKYINPS